MGRILKTLSIGTLGLTATLAIAAPQKLITHNTTDYESNAYVAGIVPSTHPTKAHSKGVVSWVEVRMACFGHDAGGKCSALIKMETNTSHPVDIGWVTLDLNTGEITPKVVTGNGYRLTVNGIGETTLSKD
ncbi:hypothetical protein [Legionella londiniensis]|uniref:Uncharacterized protein n=1 Tax=Legionella londiniensis TaxID=45068 RepID=A0A0W0VP49_9GAMM|nr:hypothetical protein [Legionella londiniensis]KTD21843.1 hypothetical protein Llon_1008 [Legionella londiniensis]STX92674.1 Uncharacterised protein [Legionella londiniensis]